jgi:flagellar hook-associated protein 3 FlgL
MYTRVTQRSISNNAMIGLQASITRLGAVQQQLTSGKLISKPSDSPSGTVTALQLRSESRAYSQYSRNAQDGVSWLNTLDSTLSDSISQVSRVRDLTVQGLSTGTGTVEGREALATEIDQLKQSLISNGNKTYLGRPVFGGTTSGATAYDASGTFVGDTTPVTRTLGPGATTRVDVSGPEAFGTGTAQLFTILSDISNHLRNDPSSLSGDLTRLDAASVRMQNAQADVGARTSRVEQLQQNAEDQILNLKSSLSLVENVDLPKTIMDLQLQQTAYQAALGATSKVIQPSLMDFLR